METHVVAPPTFHEIDLSLVRVKSRPLLVVPRESPLSVVHLENLASLARAGAHVIPAMPAFYGKPKTLQDVVDSVVGRVLDHLEIWDRASWREQRTQAGGSAEDVAERLANRD